MAGKVVGPASGAGRTSYHHGSLRRALLDAGDDVLRERGLQGFTLRECARRAGVSHAAPKHHFGGVAGFLAAIAGRGFDRLHARLRIALDAAGADLEAQFHATAVAYVGFADAFPEHFRVMFRSDLLGCDGDLTGHASGVFTELTNVVLRQRGEPEIGADTLDSALERAPVIDDIVIGWCYIHGYAHLRLEQQLDMVPAALEAGILRTASRRLSALIRNRSA